MTTFWRFICDWWYDGHQDRFIVSRNHTRCGQIILNSKWNQKIAWNMDSSRIVDLMEVDINSRFDSSQWRLEVKSLTSSTFGHEYSIQCESNNFLWFGFEFILFYRWIFARLLFIDADYESQKYSTLYDLEKICNFRKIALNIAYN